MRPVVTFALAVALVLTLRPALAQQSPGAATMPAGTQNPALVQPQLVTPYRAGPQPGSPATGATQPGPTPNEPAPSALIGPDATGGLCECLINHDPNLPPYDKTKIHRSCSPSPGACQAACNTEKYYSFVPHAIFSCPGHPGEPGSHIAMNLRPAVRYLSRR